MGTTTQNERSASTTWTWKKVKIISPQAPQPARPPKASKSASLSRWNPREPLTLVVTSRGGGECWYELRGRGRTIRLPGHLCLHDVMLRLYEP